MLICFSNNNKYVVSVKSIDEDAANFDNEEQQLDELELDEILLEDTNDTQANENIEEQKDVNLEAIDEDEGLTEEEKEAKRVQEQILQKQQKVIL